MPRVLPHPQVARMGSGGQPELGSSCGPSPEAQAAAGAGRAGLHGTRMGKQLLQALIPTTPNGRGCYFPDGKTAPKRAQCSWGLSQCGLGLSLGQSSSVPLP